MLLRRPVDLLLDLRQLGDVLRLQVGIVRLAAEQYVILRRIASNATGA